MSLRTCGFEGGLRDRVGGGCSALPQSPKPPTHSVAPGKMSAIASSGEPASLLLPLPFTQRVGSTTRCLLEKQRRWPRRAAAVTPRTRPAIHDFVSARIFFRGCVNHLKFRPKMRANGAQEMKSSDVTHNSRTTHKHAIPSHDTIVATLISALVLLVLRPQPHSGPRRAAPLLIPCKPIRLLLLEVGRRLREHEEDARPAEE